MVLKKGDSKGSPFLSLLLREEPSNCEILFPRAVGWGLRDGVLQFGVRTHLRLAKNIYSVLGFKAILAEWKIEWKLLEWGYIGFRF